MGAICGSLVALAQDDRSVAARSARRSAEVLLELAVPRGCADVRRRPGVCPGPDRVRRQRCRVATGELDASATQVDQVPPGAAFAGPSQRDPPPRGCPARTDTIAR